MAKDLVWIWPPWILKGLGSTECRVTISIESTVALVGPGASKIFWVPCPTKLFIVTHPFIGECKCGMIPNGVRSRKILAVISLDNLFVDIPMTLTCGRPECPKGQCQGRFWDPHLLASWDCSFEIIVGEIGFGTRIQDGRHHLPQVCIMPIHLILIFLLKTNL